MRLVRLAVDTWLARFALEIYPAVPRPCIVLVRFAPVTDPGAFAIAV